MEKDFWLRRWQKNEIGFHLTEPHHFLRRFFPLLRTQVGQVIFVPLCGKSPDLVWLREAGLEVIGIELSQTAIEAFFTENTLSSRWITEGGLACCHGAGYKIYCGDFFEMTTQQLVGVRSVYDRGALVALPPKMRIRYALQLAALLPTGSRILLVSYIYNQREIEGPPFAIEKDELDALFGDHFQIESLAEEDVLWSHQGLVARGVTQLTEYAVLLTRG